MTSEALPENDPDSAPEATAGAGRTSGADGDNGETSAAGSERQPKSKQGQGRGRKRMAKAKPGQQPWKRPRVEGPPAPTPVDAKPSHMSILFSPEEIAAEERRPKRKVAVLIGYSGTGYKGMQINHSEKTIEGDLFRAFVEAGAISKANANDPKKSSLMRCARTDKGVHAASNVISLKLIVPGGSGEENTAGENENKSVVDAINAHLPGQIRVWDIVRTNNGFNCHHACDSRWYEYLMPSYSLLPPHPDSFLGKKLAAAEKEKGGYDAWLAKFDSVEGFWRKVEEEHVKPILDRLDPDTRKLVRAELQTDYFTTPPRETPPPKSPVAAAPATDKDTSTPAGGAAPDDTAMTGAEPITQDKRGEDLTVADKIDGDAPGEATAAAAEYPLTPVQQAVKEIKAAYVAAKRRYRVSQTRIAKLQDALSMYVGTQNFHNYTVHKTFSDKGAKRYIKSFQVNPEPIIIGDTEWLSLKVHGQSFMMHQIRKMVAMAVLLVRCGTPLDRITESYGPRRISIPKAPGLGLLLERPVFENYSKQARENFGREAIDFSNYDEQIQSFKEEYIYKRMFEVEETENIFHVFFHQLDSFESDYFLWLTAHGFAASSERKERGARVPEALEAGPDDTDEEDPEGGGEG